MGKKSGIPEYIFRKSACGQLIAACCVTFVENRKLEIERVVEGERSATDER